MYEHILTEFLSTPWAIMPEKMAAIQTVLKTRLSGIRLSPEEINARIDAASSRTINTAGAVAVIPVYGVVSQRMNLFSAYSGGTSTELLTKQIREAAADDSIGAILLDVDSPGGSVYGVKEVAEEIYKAREHKTIVAVANSLSASAAYWIASAAEEIVVTPSGETGSIGVITAHEDWSKFVGNPDASKALPDIEFITAGKYKAEGNRFEPLSKDAREFMQKRVDDYYEDFVGAVARNRGDSVAAIKDGYGQARVLGANDSVKENLADSIATFDETLNRLMRTENKGRPRSATRRAALAQRI